MPKLIRPNGLVSGEIFKANTKTKIMQIERKKTI